MGKGSVISGLIRFAMKPHTKQFRALGNFTNLKGKNLAIAYGAATIATPIFMASEGSQRAFENSLIGGALFGPAVGLVAGLSTLDKENQQMPE